jgi:hypothetical protein
MRRRDRRSASGSFPAATLSPLFRAIAFLIVLGLIYSWAKNPQSWRWLASDVDASVSDDRGTGVPSSGPRGGITDAPKKTPEVIVPGPTDQTESEAAAVRNLVGAVSDRAPLAKIEMPAYWHFFKWARAQSFADMERRADKRVIFTQLWEQPDKYRGKLIRLRLHIRRILDWDASENPAGVRRVHEAWGWTDDSKSFPYVVVFSDAPEGMPLGDNLQQEGVFVGYFLKTMGYTAFNKNRSSPLLIGRMKWMGSTPASPPIVSRSDWFWISAVGVPLVLILAFGTWFQMFRRSRRFKLPAAAADETEMENWFRSGPETEPGTEGSHTQTPVG